MLYASVLAEPHWVWVLLSSKNLVPGKTVNFDTYHLPRTIHIPKIKSVFVTGPKPSGPFGAKGLGECAAVGTAPAIANAIYQACGIRFYKLPIFPEKMVAALKGAGCHL
jgi:CO/xanthine dehydrogenase Mo-binding subunit